MPRRLLPPDYTCLTSRVAGDDSRQETSKHIVRVST